MGILNATPDSFSDGGRHVSIAQALAQARRMIAEGAEIIDIGGESTRPGARPISAAEEILRVVPIVETLHAEWSGLISVDTTKAIVAEKTLAAGASIVNDISGLRADPAMVDVCLRYSCGIVVMHMQGTPQTMQNHPVYADVVDEVREFFQERLHTLSTAGISPQQLCFDPGIGFGKNAAHNWQIITHLAALQIDQCPIMLGVSRKSFIAQRLGDPDPSLRSWPTVGLTACGREQGAMIHRVHEVKSNLEALRMTEAILTAK